MREQMLFLVRELVETHSAALEWTPKRPLPSVNSKVIKHIRQLSEEFPTVGMVA